MDANRIYRRSDLGWRWNLVDGVEAYACESASVAKEKVWRTRLSIAAFMVVSGITV
jgi:hypothetical protein